MNSEAEVQCPYCGHGFPFFVESLDEDYDTVVDCENCCRPMRVAVHCEDGEVVSIEAGGG
ncbi:MAG: CPXCG motif-containing cysteine-rich protein [Verrucomicrobia bacterium]|nr:CPXCG motif-containing cysteine-rich protein [Verrucomicrobiota bacterium]